MQGRRSAGPAELSAGLPEIPRARSRSADRIVKGQAALARLQASRSAYTSAVCSPVRERSEQTTPIMAGRTGADLSLQSMPSSTAADLQAAAEALNVMQREATHPPAQPQADLPEHVVRMLEQMRLEMATMQQKQTRTEAELRAYQTASSAPSRPAAAQI